MIFFVSTVLLLGTIVSGDVSSGRDGIDYRLLHKDLVSTFDVNQCNATGELVCKTCTQLGMCSWDSTENDFTVTDAGNCDSGESCFMGQCMITENPTCAPTAGFEFWCTATGMFPDQGNCKKYHHCVKDTPNSFKHYNGEDCTDNYAYNAKTTYCDKKLVNDCVGYPVPVCKKTGESGALKENPAIYYSCIKHPTPPTGQADILYPALRVCPHGKTFYPTTKVCNT